MCLFLKPSAPTSPATSKSPLPPASSSNSPLPPAQTNYNAIPIAPPTRSFVGTVNFSQNFFYIEFVPIFTPQNFSS